MSEFSTTRIADYQAALTANAHLGPAIQWLQTNTPLSRLSALELFEVLQNAVTTSGNFVITFQTNSIP